MRPDLPAQELTPHAGTVTSPDQQALPGAIDTATRLFLGLPCRYERSFAPTLNAQADKRRGRLVVAGGVVGVVEAGEGGLPVAVGKGC